VFIRCPDCDGRRYRPHILEVQVGSKSKGQAVKSKVQSPKPEAGRQETEDGMQNAESLLSG